MTPTQTMATSTTSSTSTPPSVRAPPRRMITRAYRKGISPIAQLRLLHSTSPERTNRNTTNHSSTNSNVEPSSHYGTSLTPPNLSFKRPYRTRSMREAELAKKGEISPTSLHHHQDNNHDNHNSGEDDEKNGCLPPRRRRSRSRLPSPASKSMRNVGGRRKNDEPYHSTSLSSPHHSPTVPPPPRGGVLRCICNAFLLSPKECLLECRHCRNYCHPSCVGVDHLEVRWRLREDSFVCPFCVVPPSSPPPVATVENRVMTSGKIDDPAPHAFQGSREEKRKIRWMVKEEEQNGEEEAKKKSIIARNGGEEMSSSPSCYNTAHSSSSVSFSATCSSTGSSSTSSNSYRSTTTSTRSKNSEAASSQSIGALAGTLPTTVNSPSFVKEQSMSFSPAALPPVPRQAPQRLREVPDVFPHNIKVLFQALHRVQHIITNILHYSILDLPHTPLLESQVEECMDCCKVAVSAATLSASYPMYCLREVRTALHPYVQGTLLQACVSSPPVMHQPSAGSLCCSSVRSPSPHTFSSPQSLPPGVSSSLPPSPARRIVSLIFTNGMDYYGNLKPTITQLKSGIQRGHITKAELAKRVRAVDALYPEDTNPPHLHHFVENCLGITDVSDFVHITLSATHPSYQGQRLATILFTLELLKWSIRGRRRAFLNMAIEKHLVSVEGEEGKAKEKTFEIKAVEEEKRAKTEDEEEEVEEETQRPWPHHGVEKGKRLYGSSSASPPPKTSGKILSSSTSMTHRLEYVTPPASRRLYHRFGFREVFPRTDAKTGKPRFTPREADMGRVMVNFDIPTAALRAAAFLEQQYMQGADHGTLEKEGSSSNRKSNDHGNYHEDTQKNDGTGRSVLLPMGKLWGDSSRS